MIGNPETPVLLEGRNAVVHGAAGAVGGAVARAFAREGATVFLAGRTRATLDRVAADIAAAGGIARVAPVDAREVGAVERQVADVAVPMASDRTRAITGAIANVTCGELAD